MYLEERGVKFSSETDTEVLVQLISYIYHKEKVSFEDAVRKSLKRVIGAYGIVIICSDEPKQMIAARHGSPLVLGINKGEYFIASDASPIIEHTREVIYFDEDEYLIIKGDNYQIKHIENANILIKPTSKIDYSIEEIEKGNFPHFMLKEIHEQPEAISDTFRGRLLTNEAMVKLAGVEDNMKKFLAADRIIVVACGMINKQKHMKRLQLLLKVWDLSLQFNWHMQEGKVQLNNHGREELLWT